MSQKNCLVTGGASGIGLAISKRFAQKGYRVFILDYNKASGQHVEQELSSLGLSAQFYTCDVSKQEEVRSTLQSIGQPIHVLINNAGISHVGNLEQTSEEDFERLFQVNVKGVYNCSRVVIESMLKQGGGVIINMASVAAVVGIPDRFAYSMTKGAVLNMTYTIARDYVDKNIRCNALSPARIHTPFVDGFLAKNYPGKEKEMFNQLAATQPIGRMGTPDEVASMAYYLCSDEASFITGCNFPVDGGFINLKI